MQTRCSATRSLFVGVCLVGVVCVLAPGLSNATFRASFALADGTDSADGLDDRVADDTAIATAGDAPVALQVTHP